MSPNSRLNSAAFRLIAAYFGIFAVVTTIVTAFLYSHVSSDLRRNIRDRVKAAHFQLAEIAETEGVDALITVVAHRSTGFDDPLTIALYVDDGGNVLAGDIQPIPMFDGWKVLSGAQIKFINPKRKEVDKDERYYALWRPVPGGQLLIGEIWEDVEDAEQVMALALVFSLGATLLITLAGGIWLGRRAQARIQTIDAALDAFAYGKLDQRIPLSDAGDDLDRVSAHINRTFDRITALISSMRQISADIAHDLKTPISHLKQRLETVRSTATTVKDYRKALDDATGDIDSIVETFEALLRIAQIEAGARKARFRLVDLKDVLANIVDAYEHVAEDAGFGFSADLKVDGSTEVNGDPELLTQLFANILENSLRHCPSGTDIHIELSSRGDGLVVRISDKGPGIPEEERENVLRRLYRLEKSRTTPGSGLGLSLVSAIAELHDAELRLSDADPGLCVTVRFPKAAKT
ncbi:MAG: HAMP domain-containing histidine kinase [Hyphomicrobiaceae bacterium]|nr:HAMP domain-containing histidine kinase [Hyphomicrobiaceae bacterium]